MQINYLSNEIVMAGKDHDIVKDTRLHLQSVRNLNVIVEVLDTNNNVLDIIHGIIQTGSITINGESLIRRTGSVEMTLMDKVIPRSGNLVWLTNKIRVYIGIRDNSSRREEDITHYCVGTFYLSEANTTVSVSSNTVSVSLQDYMMKWEEEQLQESITIEAGVPLHIAISNVMNMIGEFNLDVEMTNVDIPYDLEFNMGETFSSVIQKIRDLYMDYECYYTVDGVFTFRKMKIQLDDGEVVKWRFDRERDISTSINKSYNFKGVKNVVKVVGKTDTNGVTVMGEYSIKDEFNPFHSNNIGKRFKVVTDTSLFTMEQCESMAVYELHNSSNMQESITISTIPIYFLDANDIIEVYNEEREDFDKVVIKNISFGLKTGDEMSISGSKLYYNMFEVNPIPIDMYRAIADEVISSIKSKGWLSLAENRIYEKFGLQARGGAEVRLRFQYQDRGGVTAYVVAYPNTRMQSLVIDLADFHSVEGDSGSQANAGKGDYADRVLGHETLHLVMNDDFGAVKTGQIPEWYKEGLGELLHGADERVKNVLIVNNLISDVVLNEVINRAYSMFMGMSTLKPVTEDYVSSYILCKIIAEKLRENGYTFAQFHDTIRISSDDGLIAFWNAVSRYIGDMEALASYITLEGANFVKNKMRLDIGMDEVDTGSIAGSDYGGQPLNAENVFDNSKANKDLFLTRFNVIVEKP